MYTSIFQILNFITVILKGKNFMYICIFFHKGISLCYEWLKTKLYHLISSKLHNFGSWHVYVKNSKPIVWTKK